jgi:hypothetical protein
VCWREGRAGKKDVEISFDWKRSSKGAMGGSLRNSIFFSYFESI